LNKGEYIYFLSDVHLGAPALPDNPERERRFVKWLDAVAGNAAEIYLLGDIFDFWFEYRRAVPRGYTRVLGKLAEITDKGIPVHFFTGNHDMWIFDYLPSETGVIVHKEAFTTIIQGKRFYLAHGDGLGGGDKVYFLIKKVFTSKCLQRLFSWLHPDLAIWLAHKWSETSRLAKDINGAAFKAEEEGLYKFALSVLEKEEVDFFIFGHRHRLADLKIGNNSRFIILGEWIRTFSYGVYDGKQFELKTFD